MSKVLQGEEQVHDNLGGIRPIELIGFWLGDYAGVALGGSPYRWGRTFLGILLVTSIAALQGTGGSPPLAALGKATQSMGKVITSQHQQ